MHADISLNPNVFKINKDKIRCSSHLFTKEHLLTKELLSIMMNMIENYVEALVPTEN